MAIDGIGGSKPPTGPSEPGAASSRTTSGEGFKLQTEAAAAPEKNTDIERLQRGEMSRDEYLNGRVQQAVSHLEGVVPASHLELIKAQLLEQMQGGDPVLSELLKRATGQAAPEEHG